MEYLRTFQTGPVTLYWLDFCTLTSDLKGVLDYRFLDERTKDSKRKGKRHAEKYVYELTLRDAVN
jgi:hypothetical protein